MPFPSFVTQLRADCKSCNRGDESIVGHFTVSDLMLSGVVRMSMVEKSLQPRSMSRSFRLVGGSSTTMGASSTMSVPAAMSLVAMRPSPFPGSETTLCDGDVSMPKRLDVHWEAVYSDSIGTREKSHYELTDTVTDGFSIS